MNRPKNKFSPMGDDLFGEQIQQATSTLRKKFIFPPFSTLNSREGLWQERKAAWLSLGIRSEVGRGGNLLKQSDVMFAHFNGLLNKKQCTPEEWAAQISKPKNGMAKKSAPGGHKQGEETFTSTGTSIFDPVLCELCYEWFCPPRGQIIDPFCGGSVRSIVASKLGRRYWGCDLRIEQIEANQAQAAKICPSNPPTFVCGDSLEEMQSAPLADFVFSCPPYGDLEKYSEDPRDLSNMLWEDFVSMYREIIFESCARLKEDRFAAFIVGDIRDKDGHYRNFIGETVAAFRDAGLHFYNECILINAVGTLALRVTRQFEGGRKVGKSHQNVLVFVKGDWKKASNAIKFVPPPRPGSMTIVPPRKK